MVVTVCRIRRNPFRTGRLPASIFSGIVLLTVLGCGGPLPDYFPMQTGNWWTYQRVTPAENGRVRVATGYRMTIRSLPDPITARVVFDDGSPPILYSKHKGFISATQTVAPDYLGARTEYLLWLIPYPGIKWTVYSCRPDTLEVSSVQYKILPTVTYKSQLGDFTDVVVVSCENYPGTARSLSYWAPGVGLLARRLYVRQALKWEWVQTEQLTAYHLESPPPRVAQKQDEMVRDGMRHREAIYSDTNLDEEPAEPPTPYQPDTPR